MRHKENDILGEMQNEESHIIQTIVWDSSSQTFIGPGMENWPTPVSPIQEPQLLFKCDEVSTTPDSLHPYFKEGSTLEVKNGHPLLLTVYRGPLIESFKLITYSDEYIRQFRSRSHNRFVALLICEQLAKSGKSEYIEELECAKANLFTADELAGFLVNLQAGKDEFFSELDRKWDGGYVAFDLKLYNICRIGDKLTECQTVGKFENQELYEQSREEFKTKVWDRLMNCTSWKGIKCGRGYFAEVSALEAFWRVYVRVKFN